MSHRSCFPTTIINRVLSLGLKDFCNSQSGGHLVATEIKVPKMVSVVSILGHLASQHSTDIRDALLQLFRVSVMYFMYCYVLLCHAEVCCVMFCNALSCWAMLHCVILSCYGMLCFVIFCYVMPCCVMSC